MINVDFIQDLAIVLVSAGLAGWICRSLGLSVTIGYLAAGMIVGPYTPPFSLVSDINRIQVLSQIGPIFLMFAIGLNLSFRKLSRLGLGLFIAVALSVSLLILACRASGAALGIGLLPSLFLAGMMLVSSSAIIGKMLHETGLIHQRFGHTAMAYTLLEDLAAILMLSILSALAYFGQVALRPLLSAFGLFMAFLVVLSVMALLAVPRFLALLHRRATPELQSLLVAGLLFLLALLAAKAGYSLALGAFLLGVVIAATPQRAYIERTFEGVNNIFTAVFFVAIGMQIEVALFRDIWPWILGIGVLAFIARTSICALALVAVGRPMGEAIQTGLVLTPIGEMSFIFAQLGLAAGILPRAWYPLAVGICLLTAMGSALAVPRADAVARAVERRLPAGLRRLLEGYHAWLERGQRRRGASLLWRYSRKRLAQVAVEIAFITGILVFSKPLGDRLCDWLGLAAASPPYGIFCFWTFIGLALTASVIAVWRNITALAMLCADALASGPPRGPYALAIEHLIRILAAFLLVMWLWIILPFRAQAGWIMAALAAAMAAGALVFWRRMIFWHSVVEGQLNRLVRPEQRRSFQERLSSLAQWNLRIEECVLPDHTRHGGNIIGDLAIRSRFGASIVGIERQGGLILNPSAATTLYPRDTLLLVGEPEAIADARAFLLAIQSPAAAEEHLEDVRLETIRVPPDSPRRNQGLAQLNISRKFGIQIIGLERRGLKQLNPGAGEQLQAEDALLVLGTAAQIQAFDQWLQHEA